MFYCEACRKKNKWPRTLSQSYGACEMCKKRASCFDCPSSSLPSPEGKPKPLTKDQAARLVWNALSFDSRYENGGVAIYGRLNITQIEQICKAMALPLPEDLLEAATIDG